MMVQKTLTNKSFFSFAMTALLVFGIYMLYVPFGYAQNRTAFESLVLSLRNPFLSFEKKSVKKDPTLIKPIVEQKIEPVIEAPKPAPIIPPPMFVTGIVFKTAQPQAIVNGVVVQRGDILGDVTILEIKEGGVLFLYKSNNFFVKYSNK